MNHKKYPNHLETPFLQALAKNDYQQKSISNANYLSDYHLPERVIVNFLVKYTLIAFIMMILLMAYSTFIGV